MYLFLPFSLVLFIENFFNFSWLISLILYDSLFYLVPAIVTSRKKHLVQSKGKYMIGFKKRMDFVSGLQKGRDF